MEIKFFRRILVGLVASGVVGVPLAVLAATTAENTVSYQVEPISEISVSGNPAVLIVNAATAGSVPTTVTDATTTYSYTANQTRKITAALNTAMPSGVTLKIHLVAPTGGTSVGDVTLTTGSADVVTGIPTVNETGKTITYMLSATVAAGVVASAQKTVTLTVLAP